MHKYLLATSAAALALALSGSAFAETDPLPSDPATTGAVTATQPTPSATESATMPPQPATPADQAPAAQVPAAQAPAGETAPVQAAAPAIDPADAPIAEQLKDLVENKLSRYMPREQDRAGVLDFYRARGFAPIWIENGKPAQRASQAIKALQGVAADGLEPEDYPTPRFDNADPARLAADELGLTNSVVVFSRHASIGRVAFTRVSGAIYFDEKAPNPAEVLARLASSKDAGATLDSFNSQAPQYKLLKAKLAALRAGENVEAATQDKDTAHAGNRKAHDKAHSKATGHRAHLSRTAEINAIIANMERWRWMPHDLGPAYAIVNIPDYTLKVVQNGKTVWQTKIVVGKAGKHATPLMMETMKFITINPTWNVPPSIIRNEYLPALARDPDALARIGLKISYNRDGSIRVYQPPSERNALGRIRFNFPNRFLVYQHDTPDKNLFDKSTRAYSHGCMRVQNPDRYAEVLLGISQPEDAYTTKRIRSLYGRGERNINLKHPIPVYISYQTAFVDADGTTQLRSDVYGLDKTMTGILEGNRRVADIPIRRNYSSGSKPVMASAARPARREQQPSGFQPFGWGAPDYDQNWRSAYQPRDRFGVW